MNLFKKLASDITFFKAAKSITSSNDKIGLTVDDLVFYVGKRMIDGEPPFDHNEWHLATVEIPSDWEAMFELLSHAHIHVVLLDLLQTKFGPDRRKEVLVAMVSKWRAAFGPDDPKQFMVQALTTIMEAVPLPEEHPVLKRPELEKWTQHRWAFGRAQAGLSLCDLPERHRDEAISELGRCFVYSHGCASTRFGAVVEKLDFIDAAGAALDVSS
jgi:hypothetical protein